MPRVLPEEGAQRLEAFERYGRLHPSPEVALDRIVRLAGRTLAVPTALILLVRDQQSWVKAAWGWEEPSSSWVPPFTPTAQFLQLGAVTDLAVAAEFAQTVALGWRFLAWVPLRAEDGLHLGWLAIADTQTRTLTADQRATLTDLAALTVDELELRLATLEQAETTTAYQELKTELQALLQAIDDVVLVLDQEGQFLNALPLDGLGQGLHDLFDPAQVEAFLQTIRYALLTGETAQIDYSLNLGDRDAWFTATITPLGHDRVLWVARDRSDREETEEILQESAAQIRLVIDSVPARIAYIDKDLHYRFVNQQYEEWAQRSAGEIVGRHIRDVLGPTMYQQLQPYLEQVLMGEEVTREGKLYSLTGVEHYSQVNYLPHFDDQGGVLGFYVLCQDISQRKQAEEALRQQDRRFRSLIENATDVIVILDVEGRFSYASPSSTPILGYTAQDVIGRAAVDLVHPDDRDLIQQTFQQALENPGVRLPIVEYRVWHHGGEWRIFEAVTTNLLHDPTVQGVVVNCHDVTTRKQAEDRYRSIYENAIEGIFQTTVSGRYLALNPALVKMLGYDSEADTIAEVENVAQQIYVCPQRRQEFVEIMASQGKVSGFESQVYRKDGSVFWVSENARAVCDPEGNLLYYEGTTIDITARKQAEAAIASLNADLERRVRQRTAELVQANEDLRREIQERQQAQEQLHQQEQEFRAVLEQRVVERTAALTAANQELANEIAQRQQVETALRHSQTRYELATRATRVGVWEWNLQTGEFYIDPNIKALLGYEDAEIPNDLEVWVKYVYPDDREATMQTAQAHLDGKTPEYVMEHRMLHKDGSVRWILARGVAIRDPQGTVTQMIGTDTDITDRKQSEARLNQSLREKETLLQEIHHRVKNNLQVISSLLDLQSLRIQDPVMLAIFQESQHRVRAMALIHEKLYQNHDLNRINLADYIQTLTAYLFQSYNTDNRVALHLNLDHTITLDVSLAIPCGLIINELVTNALKHGFPNGYRGVIQLQLYRTPTNFLHLMIANDGATFPQNLDLRHTSSLGLQLVNSLVQQLKGTLQLDQQRDSRFTIEFPLM